MLGETIESIPVARPVPTPEEPQGMCLDKGYEYAEARKVVEECLFTPHIRSRGEEKQDISELPGYRARRWVCERTNTWMNRFRRILIRWEKLEATYMAMVHFACGIIAWRASGLVRSDT